MDRKYNELSSKLKAKIPKLQKGESIKFQVLGVYMDKVTGRFICPNKVRVLPTDRIYDPWSGKKLQGKDEYEGGYVDIAFVRSERPAGQDSMRDTIVSFGDIVFSKIHAGVIEIHGGNKKEEKMLEYLYLSNYNKSNEGKPWYIKPTGAHMFQIIDNDKTASDKLEMEKKRDKAKDIIMKMSEDEINRVSAGLFPQRYNSMKFDTRVLELRKIAEKDPAKIFGLSDNVGIKMNTIIEKALKERLIILNDNKTEVQWGDDKTRICTVKPNQAPHTSIRRYFQTPEGAGVLESIEQLLSNQKETVDA